MKTQTNQENRNVGTNTNGSSSGTEGSSFPNSKSSVTRRQRMFIRRAILEETRGKRHFEKARNAIALALQNGLAVDQSVEIELPGEDGSRITEVYAIKDNFAGDVAFKRSYVSHYSLVKVPKYKRAPKPPVEAAVPVATE